MHRKACSLNYNFMTEECIFFIPFFCMTHTHAWILFQQNQNKLASKKLFSKETCALMSGWRKFPKKYFCGKFPCWNLQEKNLMKKMSHQSHQEKTKLPPKKVFLNPEFFLSSFLQIQKILKNFCLVKSEFKLSFEHKLKIC